MRLITLLAFAGLLAVALAAWGPEAGITNNRLENVTYSSSAHKVVYGKGGVGHVVWYDQAGDAVYYKRYWPGSGWSKDLQLGKTADLACPSIALDSDGTTIHVVWRMWKHVGTTNFHIFYQKCNPTSSGTGGWVGIPQDLCENVSGHDHVYPAVACGPSGQVVVTWMEAWGYPNTVRSYGFREYASGQWQNQKMIEDPIPSFRWNPSISTDKSGNVFVAYYGSRSLNPKDSFHVYVNSRIGSSWQSWENVTSSLGYPDSFIAPDIDVDPATGYPHVVCHSYAVVHNGPVDSTRDFHIYHTYRGASGWITPEMISDPLATGDCAPSMFFAANGTANVIWGQGFPDHGIAYSFRDPGTGDWGAPTWVVNGACAYTGPSLTVGRDGLLHGVWTRYDATSRYPYQIWGSSSTGSFSSGLDAGTTVTPRGLALDVSPNPVSRRMVVNYSLPVAGNVSLKLYDVRGALARTVACGNVLPGSHAVSLDRQGLVRGAYILKLESGASSLTRKLIIE